MNQKVVVAGFLAPEESDISWAAGEDPYTGAQLLLLTRGLGAMASLNLPERRLQVAMLELAIADMTATKKREQDHAENARRWVMSGYHSTRFPDVKSFEGCCLSLGLDVERWRRSILALRPSGRRAIQLSHAADRDEGYRRRRRRPKIVPREQAA